MYSELKICKMFYKKKGKINIDERVMKSLKKTYARKSSIPNFTQKPDGSKKHTRKSKINRMINTLIIAIIFDLDNTLVKS